jgi:hypothetical protein
LVGCYLFTKSTDPFLITHKRIRNASNHLPPFQFSPKHHRQWIWENFLLFEQPNISAFAFLDNLNTHSNVLTLSSPINFHVLLTPVSLQQVDSSTPKRITTHDPKSCRSLYTGTSDVFRYFLCAQTRNWLENKICAHIPGVLISVCCATQRGTLESGR